MARRSGGRASDGELKVTFLRRLELHEVESSILFMDDPDFPEERTAIVRVKWNGFQGTASGGPFWFDSEEKFSRSPQHAALCVEALENLQAFLDKMAERLEPLVTKESFDNWTVKKVQDG